MKSKELRNIHEIPFFLRFNPFIRNHYRPQGDWWYCLKSCFEIHNESMSVLILAINIWSHLVGVVLPILIVSALPTPHLLLVFCLLTPDNFMHILFHQLSGQCHVPRWHGCLQRCKTRCLTPEYRLHALADV